MPKTAVFCSLRAAADHGLIPTHMNTTQTSPALLAKGALRRLALGKTEPTPANFAKAYALEAGLPPPDDASASAPAPSAVAATAVPAVDQPSARDWAVLMERMVSGLGNGSRQWSVARKKDSLHRVLSANRRDANLLNKRLSGLMGSWESDAPGQAVEVTDSAAPAETATLTEPRAAMAPDAKHVDEATAELPRHEERNSDAQMAAVVRALQITIGAALPRTESRATELTADLTALCDRIEQAGATEPLVLELQTVCQRIQRFLGMRHDLVGELQALSHALTDSLAELVDDESWVKAQSRSLHERLNVADGARAIRATHELLNETRVRHNELRSQQSQARQAMKNVVGKILSEMGTLDEGVGQFSQQVLGCVESAQAADTAEGLSTVVQQLVTASQAVYTLVSSTRGRVQAEQAQAEELEARVKGLESELCRLSEEALTDSLTQVANRRGLAKQFDVECARAQRAGVESAPLAVGLIDLDNFKKLNDKLGHAAGDEALKALAALVSKSLRPTDQVARFGGEEFVVLLPSTELQTATDVLARLQRKLSAALFIHEEREVFVTFSAGVTLWREGETLQAALARADEGMYEAKRTGKNRTCTA